MIVTLTWYINKREPTLSMPPTRTVASRACRQYFRTLRQDYNAQGSAAVKAKKDRKNTMNTRRNRKKKVRFST
jgi:hypothetical protein